jgi:hypothetical protein
MRDTNAIETDAKLAREAANQPNPPAAPPKPPEPLPAQAAAPTPRLAAAQETVEVTAQAPVAQLAGRPTADKLTVDARSLFYGNSFAPPENVPTPGVIGGVAGVTPMRAASGALAKKAAASQAFGVRVTLLRGDEEAPVGTVLNAGEPVRMRIVPNADGFLYVTERDDGVWKAVASGPAARLKPFDTPPLDLRTAGEKEFYVVLSRQASSPPPQSLAVLGRGNVVETTAGPDRAMYVVADSRTQSPGRVVQAIKLTVR